ncbi:peptidase M23B [Psychromonas sp. CNPT3]|uniref:peptidoglycan DD-metalloendopeptidase family protein n=1 Tax=Psychromonas sp. CNPT3 TaxID=314282 RepID=UPI00006E583F|nr:peptidoglycan DD-metalloendopeptidase family protein [Psychromonas sp. CNPT3]AGH81943.1 peptidase M23B [Psychromonas sp. CNPT3]
MRYLFGAFILSFFLLGCTSIERRAPVSDLTLTGFQKPLVRKAKGSTYQVQKGDTLYSIAWVNNLPIDALIKVNQLSRPYTIYRGQVLMLHKQSKKHTHHASETPKKQTYHASKAPKKHTIKVIEQIKPTSPQALKSDPHYENARKAKISACTGQRCVKKTHKKLVQKKTTVYAQPYVDKNVTVDRKKVNAWKWPTKGKLIKTFSASKAGMKGISLSSQRGTPIYAAASGKVVYAGSGLRGYGNLIIIKHSYDYLSAYAHNERLLVHENESIKLGQKIATMGDSGTKNVFLHFEIRYRGKSVDPLRYLPKR